MMHVYWVGADTRADQDGLGWLLLVLLQPCDELLLSAHTSRRDVCKESRR